MRASILEGWQNQLRLVVHGRTVPRHAPHINHYEHHEHYCAVPSKMRGQPDRVNNPDGTVEPFDAYQQTIVDLC